MKARTSLQQFGVTRQFTNDDNASAPKIDYAQFCHYMNILANYKTMTLSKRAYDVSGFPLVKKIDDDTFVVSTGTTEKYAADYASRIVNANQQHMAKYQHECLMEAANPGRGYK